MTPQQYVLLCTGADDSKFKKCLLECGYAVDVIQVLEFEFLNLDQLQSYLRSDSYCGLILTSPRAATAVSMSREKYPFPLKRLLDIPVFCIGHTTESVARNEIGLSNTLGADSGNSKNLAHYIIDKLKDNSTRPLLLPCSDIAQDTIPKTLAESGISVEKLVVYKTKANRFLNEILGQALKKEPNVVVFCSPSVVENMVLSLNNDVSVFKKFKNIAIGPVTEQALKNLDIDVNGVLDCPESEALIKVIQNIS